MAPHSSTLAWKIPWMEEPGGLQSMGSLRLRHDWATSLSLFTFLHWRRKWQPTPVFLPGESQGQGSLVGCRLWGRTESDTTKRLSSSSSNRIGWRGKEGGKETVEEWTDKKRSVSMELGMVRPGGSNDSCYSPPGLCAKKPSNFLGTGA